ncbi:MAG: hypothetical protein F6K50_18765 [Moorea sp. SIO3I7]|uniref:Uncharacterized protein n=1 Tax=Moorena producens PAL-8-15-08-1 TaxID=1458985 RepID=A0A1D8TTF7_9CYAN|nr:MULTISPECIES: hypothetical protein [Moorena]NEN97492.1 hypothetical protein [Moorena sp. SIO3I7]NEO48555.1 hypothetical protein [Moorena sp. SIO4A3]AOX00919.1 hypothetical protein BJP34_17015 [Moorena producens PAL-8-15-08-1]NEO15439.1 hypothetical protein [Moorena sp. SIO3E8]NEQ02547.1 hypothetical protein [Moorena sp. SIO3F7]
MQTRTEELVALHRFVPRIWQFGNTITPIAIKKTGCVVKGATPHSTAKLIINYGTGWLICAIC